MLNNGQSGSCCVCGNRRCKLHPQTEAEQQKAVDDLIAALNEPGVLTTGKTPDKPNQGLEAAKLIGIVLAGAVVIGVAVAVMIKAAKVTGLFLGL
jgi:hypothetical protein